MIEPAPGEYVSLSAERRELFRETCEQELASWASAELTSAGQSLWAWRFLLEFNSFNRVFQIYWITFDKLHFSK